LITPFHNDARVALRLPGFSRKVPAARPKKQGLRIRWPQSLRIEPENSVGCIA